jgi:hypothetical protein
MSGRGAARCGLLIALCLAGCKGAARSADDLYARGSAKIASGEYREGVALMQRILDGYPETAAAGRVRADWSYYQELLTIEAERLPVRAAEDLRHLGRAAEAYRRREGRYPPDLQALVPKDLARLPADPWGNPYSYRLDGRGYVLATLGRDGAPGGTGEDRDIRVVHGRLVNAPIVRPPREEPPAR